MTSLEPDMSDVRLQFVSLTIDGDDPIRQYHPPSSRSPSVGDITANGNGMTTNGNGNKENDIEIIHVPITGLLDRLQNYNEQGYVIDSRVYAFAIGLQCGENLHRIENIVEPESPM